VKARLSTPRLFLLALLLAGLGWVVVEAGHRFGPGRPPVDRSLTGSDVEIRFWYGADQVFGRLGAPQRWINVLGSIQPAAQVGSASYQLNGGVARSLSLGGDLHRLALEGDFNVELAWDEVRAGENDLSVAVQLRNGAHASTRMTFRVVKGKRWPLPYAIDFREVTDLQEVAQIVDGFWRLDSMGVRTAQPYYDRVLAIGDTTWTDYQVTARLTVHDFTPPEPRPPTYDVTHFGLALRWRGHHDDGLQPRRKWFPLGAQGEFLVRVDPGRSMWRVLFDQTEGKPHLYSADRRRTELGSPFLVKAQVSTLPDGRTRYRFKEWPEGTREPEIWDIEGYESGDYPSGGACLVAHNTDVTIHEVWVEALEPGTPDTDARQ